jgi:hypothetical protein
MDFTVSFKELYKFSSCAGNSIYIWISVIGQWILINKWRALTLRKHFCHYHKKLPMLLLNSVFMWFQYSIQKCYGIQFPQIAFPLWIIHYACLCFLLTVAGIKLQKILCQSLKCHYMALWLVCSVLSATIIIWLFFLFVKLYTHNRMLYTFWHNFCITCPLTSLSSIMKAEHNLLIKFNRIHPEVIITAEL